MTSDDDRCSAAVRYGAGRVVRCEQDAGHKGVHWSDEAGVVWTWNDTSVFAAS